MNIKLTGVVPKGAEYELRITDTSATLTGRTPGGKTTHDFKFQFATPEYQLRVIREYSVDYKYRATIVISDLYARLHIAFTDADPQKLTVTLAGPHDPDKLDSLNLDPEDIIRAETFTLHRATVANLKELLKEIALVTPIWDLNRAASVVYDRQHTDMFSVVDLINRMVDR